MEIYNYIGCPYNFPPNVWQHNATYETYALIHSRKSITNWVTERFNGVLHHLPSYRSPPPLDGVVKQVLERS